MRKRPQAAAHLLLGAAADMGTQVAVAGLFLTARTPGPRRPTAHPLGFVLWMMQGTALVTNVCCLPHFDSAPGLHLGV